MALAALLLKSHRVDAAGHSGVTQTGIILAAPVLSGSVTGTYTLAGTPTLTAPTINGGTSTGTRTVTTITGDGAITIATGIVALTKGSAAAITLAAPSAPQAGTEIVIVAGSDFAHVVTATGLINDGVTGGSKTTATFAAFIGASITLVAYNLKWIVKAKNVVTIT